MQCFSKFFYDVIVLSRTFDFQKIEFNQGVQNNVILARSLKKQSEQTRVCSGP